MFRHISTLLPSYNNKECAVDAETNRAPRAEEPRKRAVSTGYLIYDKADTAEQWE